MPTGKLTDVKPLPDKKKGDELDAKPAQQGGTGKLSDVKPINDNVGKNIDLKKKWYSMTRDQRELALHSLSPDEINQLVDDLGIFGSGKATLSKQPEWKGMTMVNTGPVNIPIPAPESIQYLKNIALDFLRGTQSQLSNIGGPIGAHAGKVAGAAIGEAIDPLGGGVPGGYTGEIIGASIGGGGAEAIRQLLEHVEGLDKYNEPWQNAPGEQARRIGLAARDQAGAEIVGHAIGKLLRPTLKRSINNLYDAGKLEYGDPLGKGQLESVIDDVLKTENISAKAGHPSLTVGDFINVVNQTKKEIGQEVDKQMLLPIRQGNSIVPLGKAHANTTSVVNAINHFLTSDPSIVKIASLKKAGKEAAHLESIKKEALLFSQTPWTFEELADRRIKLNNELAPLYSLPKGEQRVYLLDHPDLAYKKAEADAIRDVIYPQMDILSGKRMGGTAELQGKRGALMNLENQLTHTLAELKTSSRQGATKGMNIGGYATPSGIGVGLHRLPLKLSANNVEAQADRKVASAFGNSAVAKIRKKFSSPFGIDTLGNTLLSSPLRILIGVKDVAPTPKPPVSQEGEPQSSVRPTASPRELLEKAKRITPIAQGEVAYHAVHPGTGHRVISRDGQVWFDPNTGQQVS